MKALKGLCVDVRYEDTPKKVFEKAGAFCSAKAAEAALGNYSCAALRRAEAHQLQGAAPQKQRQRKDA